jgi:hypothetical protein
MKTDTQINKIVKAYEKTHSDETWQGKWVCEKCGCITTDPGFVTPQSGLPCPEALCQNCESEEHMNEKYRG